MFINTSVLYGQVIISTLVTCLIIWGLTYGVDGDEGLTELDPKAGEKNHVHRSMLNTGVSRYETLI